MSSPFVNISEYQTTTTPPIKTAWPELLNTNVDVAINKIKASVPASFSVVKIKNDAMVTMDHRTNRVRVFYDPSTNTISRAPRVG